MGTPVLFLKRLLLINKENIFVLMRFKLLSHWSAVVLELQRSPWGQNLKKKKKKKKKRITELYAPLSSIIRCNCGMLTIGAIFTYSWIELDSYFFLSCLFSLKKKKKETNVTVPRK